MHAALAAILGKVEQDIAHGTRILDAGCTGEGDVLAQHQAHHVGAAHSVQRPGLDQLAIAQDGHAVGDGKDLIEEMRNKDDSKPARLEVADDLKQALDLISVKARSGLVQDQHLAREFNGASDRDDLLYGDRIGPQLARWVDLKAVTLEDVAGLPLHLPAINQAKTRGLMAKEEIFGNGPVGEEIDLLIDRADAVGLGLLRIIHVDRLAVGQHLPSIGLVGAGENLDQG